MLELLFSSSARVKILTLFLLNPENRFYQREIGGLTGLPIRAVQVDRSASSRISGLRKERL